MTFEASEVKSRCKETCIHPQRKGWSLTKITWWKLQMKASIPSSPSHIWMLWPAGARSQPALSLHTLGNFQPHWLLLFLQCKIYAETKMFHRNVLWASYATCPWTPASRFPGRVLIWDQKLADFLIFSSTQWCGDAAGAYPLLLSTNTKYVNTGRRTKCLLGKKLGKRSFWTLHQQTCILSKPVCYFCHPEWRL